MRENMFQLAWNQRKANSNTLAKTGNAWCFQSCGQIENFSTANDS